MTHILTGVEIQRFDQHWVDSHNQRYNAHWVIDATGWGKIAGPLGYQKFFGMEVELENPHQLQNPILKDARIPQTDGYRFMYSLPMSASSLLIEDTYYSNTPHLHIQQWRQEVIEYCQKHFGKIKSVTHEEIGCLPLALTAQLDNPLKIIHLGAASGFYQPITGYSLPQTLRMMELIIAGIGKGLTNTQIIAEQKSYIKNWQPQLNYLLWLNRMLFIAAEPEKRYLILERFYRLQPQLVHRFYRGELTTFDKIRILFGKPPVSIRKALKAFWT